MEEKNTEDKLAYMLLPFTDYLYAVSAHKKENVSLFEHYVKSKPPFNPDGLKQQFALRRVTTNAERDKERPKGPARFEFVRQLIAKMQLTDVKDFENRTVEFEKLASNFLKTFRQLKDERAQKQLMDQLKVNLFEGTEDEHGNYTPGKFELLTLPDYYKYVDMPMNQRPRNWMKRLTIQARDIARAK